MSALMDVFAPRVMCCCGDAVKSSPSHGSSRCVCADASYVCSPRVNIHRLMFECYSVAETVFPGDARVVHTRTAVKCEDAYPTTTYIPCLRLPPIGLLGFVLKKCSRWKATRRQGIPCVNSPTELVCTPQPPSGRAGKKRRVATCMYVKHRVGPILATAAVQSAPVIHFPLARVFKVSKLGAR